MCIGALILAGGASQRMGGKDKGLMQLNGQALVDHVITNIRHQQPHAPQHIAINANRHTADYAHRGYPIWADEEPYLHQGPLAGFVTGLRGYQRTMPEVTHLWVVPCDCPIFPRDLLARLAASLIRTEAMVSTPCSTLPPDNNTRIQAHPTFCLMRMDVLPHLEHYLRQGGRKVFTWAQAMDTATVMYDTPAPQEPYFFNANTPTELATLRQGFARAT